MSDRTWLTSSELGDLHGVGRDRMEFLLREAGLRSEDDDGGTRYDSVEVEHLLAARDERLMRSSVELLDHIEDVALAAEVLHHAFFELRLSWLQSRVSTGDIIDVLRHQLTSRLPQLVSLQRARGGTGGLDELAILARFEQTLVGALAERRGQPSPGQAKRAAASKKEG